MSVGGAGAPCPLQVLGQSRITCGSVGSLRCSLHDLSHVLGHVCPHQKEHRPVPMTHLEATFQLGCIHEVRARELQLPYEDAELSMLILLPDDGVT